MAALMLVLAGCSSDVMTSARLKDLWVADHGRTLLVRWGGSPCGRERVAVEAEADETEDDVTITIDVAYRDGDGDDGPACFADDDNGCSVIELNAPLGVRDVIDAEGDHVLVRDEPMPREVVRCGE